MNPISSILFWAGIVLVVDGSLGVLFQERWQRLVEDINIQRIALIEIAVGFLSLAVHYFILPG